MRRRLADLVRGDDEAWFSIARARSSTSQWSRPVVIVKAAGTVISCAPASARIRNSSGKRRS